MTKDDVDVVKFTEPAHFSGQVSVEECVMFRDVTALGTHSVGVGTLG
jgi:hypothetical protein